MSAPEIHTPMTVTAAITSDTGTALLMLRYPHASPHQLHVQVVNTSMAPYEIRRPLAGLIIRTWPPRPARTTKPRGSCATSAPAWTLSS